MSNPLAGPGTRAPTLTYYDAPCGCRAEGIIGTRGTYWVPVEGCGQHCPCIACERVRALEREVQQA